VAEGFGRYNPTEIARFLDVSRASGLEVQTCVRRAHSTGYITSQEFHALYRLANRAIQALAGFQRYLRSERARENAKRFRYRKHRSQERDLNQPNALHVSSDSNAPNDPNDPND
jgi:hypothetical protein